MWVARNVALAAAALLCACRGLPEQAPVPASPGPIAGASWDQDDGYLQARAVADKGAPSPYPELDAIAALASATTPDLTLAELLAPASRQAPAARLRPGDVVALDVYGRPELGGDRRVGPDGQIPMFVGGGLGVAGLTEGEASSAAAERLAELTRLPQVQVRLLHPAPAEVRVVGRVERPGAQPVPPERVLDLVDLVAQCGGLSPDADVEHLTLLRDDAEGRTRGFHFGYPELLATRSSGLSVALAPGDLVVVPRLPDVYVFGRVQRAGALPLRPGATVASLLIQAGGPTDGASVRDLQLLRAGQTRAAALDRPLAAGDVVFVPERPRVYLVGAGVATSGPIDLPSSGLTVVQAIAAAGWLTKHADLDGVEVLRYRSGEGTRFQIPLRQLLSGALRASEYLLQPGDVVHVPETVW